MILTGALEHFCPCDGFGAFTRRSAFFGLTFCSAIQNAPSRMAPTKANTAHTASMSSFTAKSTSDASVLFDMMKD